MEAWDALLCVLRLSNKYVVPKFTLCDNAATTRKFGLIALQHILASPICTNIHIMNNFGFSEQVVPEQVVLLHVFDN